MQRVKHSGSSSISSRDHSTDDLIDICKVTGNMGSVVKSMDSALRSMDLEKVSVSLIVLLLVQLPGTFLYHFL